MEANVEQLTRWAAYFFIDAVWWRYRGPFAAGVREPQDRFWKWNHIVRRHRKNPYCRCVMLRKPDDHRVQAAAVYRFDGVSTLKPGAGAVHLEYLAASPGNRSDYARQPLHRGAGEGLLMLSILHSYDWGLGGRVTLFSISGALQFYLQYGFLEVDCDPTIPGVSSRALVPLELPSTVAIELLEKKGLI